jgi:hypothetical protein
LDGYRVHLGGRKRFYASEKREPIGTNVTLAYWGGTIGSETQAIADVRLPVVGERLLVFLRPNWARELGFTPVVGFNQGLFNVVPDVTSGAPLVHEASGQPLSLTASGDVVRRRDGVANAATVSLETFIAWLHANIGLIKAARSERSPAVDRNDPRILRTFAKTPSLLSSSDSPTTNAARSPDETPSAELTAGAPANPSTDLISGPGGTLDGSPIFPQYVTSGKTADLPIVVNNFPSGFTPWSPEDQYQMSKWNYYASDVFHVRVTPTGTYSWPDGVFDLDGFPSSADLQFIYGVSWDSHTVAVTFLRYSFFNLGNTIVEADIAINPAFGFTLDDEWVFNGSGNVQSFRLTMLHELGHMHGLDHQFNFLAVMNYVPSFYRFFALPYMDDAAGIRAEYPSKAVNRTDLGVYLYYETGFQSVTDATYPSSVVAGGNLTFGNYHVENVGTNTISTPTIEWYLTAERNFNSAYYYLGERAYSSLPPFTYFTPSTVQTTFTVPTNVPTGTYYLAGFIRNDSGAFQSGFPFSNNYAFSRTRIQVVTQPVNYTITVSASPSAGGTVSGGGTFPAGSSRTVTATANSGYTFTNWTENGSVVSSSASYTFTLNANRNLVANFTTVNYTITVSASPSAGGTVSGGGTFPAGSSRTVTATANSGYTFVNWTENGSVVSSSASYTFTLNANRNLVANFNSGSHTATIGLYVPTTGGFYLRNSNTTGGSDTSFSYGPGGQGWIPLVGDWNGDGTDTVGLYNPANGTFYLRNSNSIGFADITFSYGPPGQGWIPVTGDWNGDGVDTVGLYNPANGVFYLRNTNSVGVADITFSYGPVGQGWIPIAGDWNGDGVDTVGLYNPSNSAFYLRNSNTVGNADLIVTFGPAGSGWTPIVGDWDGDGTDTIGLYNPSIGGFYLRNSNSFGGADVVLTFGPANAGWKPIVGDWDGL